MGSDPAKSRRNSDAANHYAARLLQHLVVPTFVIDADRRVVGALNIHDLLRARVV